MVVEKSSTWEILNGTKLEQESGFGYLGYMLDEKWMNDANSRKVRSGIKEAGEGKSSVYYGFAWEYAAKTQYILVKIWCGAREMALKYYLLRYI